MDLKEVSKDWEDIRNLVKFSLDLSGALTEVEREGKQGIVPS